MRVDKEPKKEDQPGMKAEVRGIKRGNGIDYRDMRLPPATERTIGALATLVQCHWFGPPFAALQMAKSHRRHDICLPPSSKSPCFSPRISISPIPGARPRV